MTTGAVVAAATAPNGLESFILGSVPWLILAALLVIVIGVPTMIVLMVRKQKVSEPGSKD